MSRKTNLPKLIMNDEELKRLREIAESRTKPLREVQRAKILLKYTEKNDIKKISNAVHVNRKTVYKCIKNGLAAGIEKALKDKYHSAKNPVITDAAKTWVVNLACTKPKDQNYANEIWSLKLLSQHAREHGTEVGHACLARVVKSTIHKILKSHNIKPHKIRYYLERRDPEFERKMNEVLVVYKEVNLQNESPSQDKDIPVITISIDEKPGVQAIKNTTEDLPPVPGKHECIGRDYEYKRLGTLSILAALDLHTGHVIGQVHNRHRSREFIELLKEIDSFYPEKCRIRVILDNHSAHISAETMRYLASKPNRFIYVHTPKHGSWLNLIETLFGKMARTFLKGIRVNSLQELRDRILKGIDEINSSPVLHRWSNFNFAN